MTLDRITVTLKLLSLRLFLSGWGCSGKERKGRERTGMDGTGYLVIIDNIVDGTGMDCEGAERIGMVAYFI